MKFEECEALDDHQKERIRLAFRQLADDQDTPRFGPCDGMDLLNIIEHLCASYHASRELLLPWKEAAKESAKLRSQLAAEQEAREEVEDELWYDHHLTCYDEPRNCDNMPIGSPVLFHNACPMCRRIFKRKV